MKSAVVPMRPERVFRLEAGGIDNNLQHAAPQRLGVLRHEQDMCTFFLAHFLNVFRKTGGVSQVQAATRLAAVTIAAGDYSHIPLSCEIVGFAVFLPASQSAEFESMNVLPELGHKGSHCLGVNLFASAHDVPHGVIENDEHLF